jgi:hypothetical protein
VQQETKGTAAKLTYQITSVGARAQRYGILRKRVFRGLEID